MDKDSMLEIDNKLNEQTLNKATDYVLYLHSCIEDFKRKKGVFYESNPAVYPLFNPFLNKTGSLLLYRRLSGKIVMQMTYDLEA